MVTSAGDNGKYGLCVIVDHHNGYATLYAHNSTLRVSKGDEVKKGDVIALMGSTGNATGPNCHFEILLDGVNRNPLEFITISPME
jgi:murein DD-endopeptidase MepM/ murein hydrolase activator NlpD